MEILNHIITKVAPQDIAYYSQKDIAYQLQDDRYHEFYAFPPQIDAIPEVIDQKRKQPIDRKLLTSVISDAYKVRGLSESQSKSLENLKTDNGFTVITAHQPSLFTGPLYLIFKICSAIKMTKELKAAYPEYNFVPVFISGGEDHDFEEVNHTYLFGKRIEWQNNLDGSVGRMPIDNGFKSVVKTFLDILGEKNHGTKIQTIINHSIETSINYGEFNFNLINELFASYGLLVVNMDNPRLKKAFTPLILKEVLERPSQAIIQKTQDLLVQQGFSSQAYPREINFFYLQDNSRARIEVNRKVYKVVGQDKKWTEEALINEINDHPERFSPNVIMRPIYQEMIFPNIIYIGGGGEIAYWLERKAQFEHFQIPLPMLVRRNSAMFIPVYIQRQLNELEIKSKDVFREVDDLINRFIARNTVIDIDLWEEKEKILAQYEVISEKAKVVDPTISKWVQAEKIKQEKIIDQIESRLKRSIKKREEIKINQIRKIKNKLFPNNGLQERNDNIFQYYLQEGPALIDTIIEVFDPFDHHFNIINLENS